MSPIVDCGVHYVDVMCQMTGARPVRVSAIGARLTDEIAPAMYNYGQLQVTFDDGSVGWYEAGWGPMMSETAYFVKDVIGPTGVRVDRDGARGRAPRASDDVGGHTKTNCLRVHRSDLDARPASSCTHDEFLSYRGRAGPRRAVPARAGTACCARSATTSTCRRTWPTRSTACASCSRPTRACGAVGPSNCETGRFASRVLTPDSLEVQLESPAPEPWSCWEVPVPSPRRRP